MKTKAKHKERKSPAAERKLAEQRIIRWGAAMEGRVAALEREVGRLGAHQCVRCGRLIPDGEMMNYGVYGRVGNLVRGTACYGECPSASANWSA